MTQPQAMLLSILIEAPIAVALGRRLLPEGGSAARLLLVAIAMTLITHRFAWTLNTEWTSWPFWMRAPVIEGLVVLLEGALLARWARLGWRYGYGLALVVNAASFGLGLLILRALR